MTEINLRDMYQKVFHRFDLDKINLDMLNLIASGSEKAEDFEEIIKHDSFFTEVICKKASAAMKSNAVSSLSHGVVLVGVQKARDFVIAHGIKRMFDPNADKSFSLETFDEVIALPKHAILAEEFAKRCENDYSGLAYACGYLFDVFNLWMGTDEKTMETQQAFLEEIWKHSLNTASLAWALATHEKILISHRKLIFGAGIVHEIGRLGLSMFDMNEYKKAVDEVEGARESHVDDDSYEVAAEKKVFDLTHPEVGSTILFHTQILRDFEEVVDFHHDLAVLKIRHPDAFLGGAILKLADRLSWLLKNKKEAGPDDMEDIIKPLKEYIPLTTTDLGELCGAVKGASLLIA